MGKNKRSQLKYFDKFKNSDIEVDSVEEWQFYAWLVEAKDLGICIDFEYQPNAFLICNKQTYIPIVDNPKNKEKHLLAEHSYTCDFRIILNPKYVNIYGKLLKTSRNDLDDNGNVVAYIDIKGGFNLHGGDRLMSIHQKLVMEKYGKYIVKLVPKDAFKILGVPQECRRTIKTKKISHAFDGYNFISTQFGISV